MPIKYVYVNIHTQVHIKYVHLRRKFDGKVSRLFQVDDVSNPCPDSEDDDGYGQDWEGSFVVGDNNCHIFAAADGADRGFVGERAHLELELDVEAGIPADDDDSRVAYHMCSGVSIAFMRLQFEEIDSGFQYHDTCEGGGNEGGTHSQTQVPVLPEAILGMARKKSDWV